MVIALAAGCTMPPTPVTGQEKPSSGTYVSETKESYWTFDDDTITIQEIGPFYKPVKYLFEYEVKENILCLRQIPDGNWNCNYTLEYFKEYNLIKIVFNEDITWEVGGAKMTYPKNTKFILYKEE